MYSYLIRRVRPKSRLQPYLRILPPDPEYLDRTLLMAMRSTHPLAPMALPPTRSDRTNQDHTPPTQVTRTHKVTTPLTKAMDKTTIKITINNNRRTETTTRINIHKTTLSGTRGTIRITGGMATITATQGTIITLSTLMGNSHRSLGVPQHLITTTPNNTHQGTMPRQEINLTPQMRSSLIRKTKMVTEISRGLHIKVLSLISRVIRNIMLMRPQGRLIRITNRPNNIQISHILHHLIVTLHMRPIRRLSTISTITTHRTTPLSRITYRLIKLPIIYQISRKSKLNRI